MDEGDRGRAIELDSRFRATRPLIRGRDACAGSPLDLLDADRQFWGDGFGALRVEPTYRGHHAAVAY
jgi:hypothetical protein